MWTFKMIVIFEFPAVHIHMLVAKYDKMVQAFLLTRLDESLDEGNRIRRLNGGTMRFNLGLFEHFQKWYRILAIVIVHHDFKWELLLLMNDSACSIIQVFSDALGQSETMEKYQQAIRWGVDCIQTDHPLRLLRAMEQSADKAIRRSLSQSCSRSSVLMNPQHAAPRK